MPWVFYSPPTGLIIKEMAAITHLKVLAEPPLEFKELPMLAKIHSLNRDPTDRFAQTSHLTGWEERGDSKGFNQINGAINQVLNATEHQVRNLENLIKLVPGIMMVICPLIVLDGEMFEYDLSKDGQPNLRRTSYVKYLATTIRPETKLEMPNKQTVTTSFTQDFLIDIVTKDSLPEYIGWLEEDMRLIMSP
jgi:hypothetical protein